MDDRERVSQTSAQEELSKQQRNCIISHRESMWKAHKLRSSTSSVCQFYKQFRYLSLQIFNQEKKWSDKLTPCVLMWIIRQEAIIIQGTTWWVKRFPKICSRSYFTAIAPGIQNRVVLSASCPGLHKLSIKHYSL